GIPAPPFQEAERARAFSQELGTLGLHPTIDSAGNVFAAYEAAGSNPVIVDAHLDTVFPASTPLHLRRKAKVLFMPGISDNGSGIVALIWALRPQKKPDFDSAVRLLRLGALARKGKEIYEGSGIY